MAATSRFASIAAKLALLCCVAAPTTGQAQSNYPERPIRLVVPYGAGGVADVGMRLLGEKLSTKLKQQIFVDNRPGAGAIVAAASVTSAPADGYSLLMVGNNNAIAASLFNSLPYNVANDFLSISTTSYFDLLIATSANSGPHSMAEFIQKAKAAKTPMNVATTIAGSTQNLAAVLLSELAGVKLTIVPYRTSPEIATALLRGDVDVAFEFYSGLSGPINDGKVRVLASAGSARVPYLKDVPTVIESGVPNYLVQSWNGISALKGTSPQVVQILNQAINEVILNPDIQSKALAVGMEMKASSPEKLTDLMKGDTARWAEVIKNANIPKQN